MTLDEAVLVWKRTLLTSATINNILTQTEREALDQIIEAAEFMSDKGPEDSEQFVTQILFGEYKDWRNKT